MTEKNNKKVQFLPGLGEKPREYKRLSNYLNVIDVDWNTGKMVPNIIKDSILAGFSMGALLVCEYAIKNHVDTLVLCSPTPGAESLEEIKSNMVIFLAGSEEKWVIKEIKRVRKTLKCKSKLIVVPDSDHKIIRNYQKKLIEVITDK